MRLFVLYLVVNILGSFGILLNDLTPADLQQMKSEWKAEILAELDIKLPSKINDVIRANGTRQVIAEVCREILGDTHIAFNAGLSHDIVNPSAGSHLVFDKIKINAGNGYNPRHGVFSAPIAGLYMFIVNIVSAPNGKDRSLHVNIMVKDAAVAYTFLDAYGTAYYWKRQSDTVIVHLTRDDDVWLKVFEVTGSPTINGDGGPYLHSHFSGFLISKD